MAFEQILQSISDEADRTKLTDLAKQFPALKEYYEIGEQAKPAFEHVNRVRELSKNPAYDLTKTAKLAADYMGWKGSAWDDEAGMTREEKRAKELVVELQNRVAELETQVGTEMTAEEIKALAEGILVERGVVTKADLPKLLPMDRFYDKDGKSIVATVPEVDRYMNSTTGRFQQVYADLTPQVGAHHEMFKEAIDINKVFNTMEEHFKSTGQMMKPMEAYKAAYADKFTERDKVQRQADIDAAKAAGIEEGRKQAAQSQGGRGMPVGAREGQQMGSVMKRVMARVKKDNEGKTIEAPLGKGVIAAAAAEEYVAKQNGAGTL